MDATDLMNALVKDSLKGIAKRLGIPKTITRKPELIVALRDFLTTNPAGFVNRLEPMELSLLAEAVHNDNRICSDVFEAKYVVKSARTPPWDNDDSLLQMVTTRERDSTDIKIPPAIAKLLRPLLNKPEPPKPVIVDRIPETLKAGRAHDPARDIRPIHVFKGEGTVFFELGRMLRLVQAGKVRVQPKSGRPTPSAERDMRASLAVPDFDLDFPNDNGRSHAAAKGDPVRAHAWAVLLQQCGWCKAAGGTLKLTKEGRQMLDQPSPAAFQEGVGRLVYDDQFDEFQRINNIRGQSGNAKRWMTEPWERRQEIFDGLLHWPVNGWMTFDQAYRFLFACGHPFTVTDAPDSLYFCEQRYGAIGDSDHLNRQYLRVLLFETLATLGLVDVAYVYPHLLWPELRGHWGTDDLDFCGRYDGLQYVRLTPLGSYCFGESETYSPPVAEKRNLFTVLGNHELVETAGTQLAPGEVSMLERFAHKLGDGRWRIDPRLFLDYLESGGSIEEVSRFLAENVAEEIPDSLHEWFDHLKVRASAVVKTEEALLVEFRDPALASHIARDPQFGKLCQPAGPTQLAVLKSNARAFRNALKKLGYLLPN